MMEDLRQYQRNDLNALMACVQRRVPGFLYVLPTAGGKTRVFTRLCFFLLQQLNFNICIFVHRKELLHQAVKTLKEMGLDVGVIAPGHEPTSHQIHVASIDTVDRRLHSLRPFLSTIDLAIFDEAHHIVASSWGRVQAALVKALIMGCTATPWRQDGKPLGSAFVEAVKGPTKAQLIKWGYIAPSVVFAPDLNVDLSGITKRGGDFARGELNRVMEEIDLRPVVKSYAHFCPGVPAITFCAGVNSAFRVAEAFSASGWMATNLDGSMGVMERENAISGLGKGRIQNLTSCDIISEGTDIPIVGAALNLRPTESTALYDQQNGRTFRLHKGKKHSVILDFVQNWAKHGLPEADREWSLREGLISIDKNNTLINRCPRCSRVHEKADRCPTCGHVYRKVKSCHNGLNDTQLRGVPGIRCYSARQIRDMSFQSALEIAKNKRDLERVAYIRGLPKEWVGQVLQRRHAMKRRGVA